jgi:site-specific DNA-methyltransferase (cytosine-N4-specific)
LRTLPAASVALCWTSPPFEGVDGVHADDPAGHAFVHWLRPFFREFARLLTPNGSVVIEMGHTWLSDQATRGVQNATLLATLVGEDGWHLVQEFYWYNPHQLTPRPDLVEPRLRFHDSVSLIYWLARSPQNHASTAPVIGAQAGGRADGNFLVLDDGEDDATYLADCVAAGEKPHPDRHPVAVPGFFIDFLTAPGDLVLDPLAGTGTTGLAAHARGRHWLCIERSPEMIAIARRRLGSLPAVVDHLR